MQVARLEQAATEAARKAGEAVTLRTVIGSSLRLAGLVLVLGGCGLVTQGVTQTLHLETTPSNAQATFAGHNVTTPADLTLSRRHMGWSVLRATKPGYDPACVVIGCGVPKYVRVLNSIFLGVGWFVDLAAGSLRNCPPPPVVNLTPQRPDEVPYALPSDEEIIAAYRGSEGMPGINICATPYLLDPEFAATAARIVVTTGNLSRTYEILGPVDYTIIGSDYVTARAASVILKGVAFAETVHVFSKADPVTMNEIIRRVALYRYGSTVDAVINVDYQTNPRNDVTATGLAISFTKSDEPRQ